MKKPVLVCVQFQQKRHYLDIESEKGKELFKKLAAKTDFVIESFPPGYMDSLGAGYEALSKDYQSLYGHP